MKSTLKSNNFKIKILDKYITDIEQLHTIKLAKKIVIISKKVLFFPIFELWPDLLQNRKIFSWRCYRFKLQNLVVWKISDQIRSYLQSAQTDVTPITPWVSRFYPIFSLCSQLLRTLQLFKYYYKMIGTHTTGLISVCVNTMIINIKKTASKL